MQEHLSIQSIMKHFASSTGLTDLSREPRRYLWTDAFAVCNYLELYRQTGVQECLELAIRLVTQVHQVLGKHRKDSTHTGWLSGFDEIKAQNHPTCGGLRIGKKLNERQPDEPIDESLEWYQDGQYFHYLTKWMHALNCVSQVTGNSIYNKWAIELAKVAHAKFTYTPSGSDRKRIYWKMSIDLSHPLVNSMGHHDPLDGLITYQQLEATGKHFSSKLSLKTEIEDMSKMCSGEKWATQDALGIGGLLTDANKLFQLRDKHHLEISDLLESLLQDIEYSLQAFMTHNQLHFPAQYRLAFRELGLSIGLHAIGRMHHTIKNNPDHFKHVDLLNHILTRLYQFYPVAELIDTFWSQEEHRLSKSWLDHEDINNVMLATSLAPESYLGCV